MFPLLAILAAIGWMHLLQWLSTAKWVIPVRSKFTHWRVVLTLLLLLPPYIVSLVYITRPDPVKYDGTEAYGHYIEQLSHERDYYITSLFYRPDLRFYQLAYQTKGYEIRLFDPSHPPAKGSKVMICGEEERNRLGAAASFDKLHQQGKCLFVEIK